MEKLTNQEKREFSLLVSAYDSNSSQAEKEDNILLSALLKIERKLKKEGFL